MHLSQSHYSIPNVNNNKGDDLKVTFLLPDWLKENEMDLNFKVLLIEDLADMLRRFYGTVLSRKGNEYSKSGLVNLCAGLNHHLQEPPHKRTLDLMNNRDFLQANKVLTGRLRDNKGKGKDKSKHRIAIEQHDLEKLFQSYFTPAIQTLDTYVLDQKIFFNIVYYMGCRGKEGLRDLNKKSFEIKTGSDGLDYIELTFYEKTKKNQGDQNSSGQDALHNDHHIISAQPGIILCPIRSFKTYISLLNPESDVFFQYASKDKKSYDKKPIGKNTLATMMKEISTNAKLSKVYTNHCICKTTTTAMKRQGFDLNEIQNVIKHKNLDSLKHYISGPTYKEKQNYNKALLNYAENETKDEETPVKK